MEQAPTYTAFAGETMVASGPLEVLLPALKARFDLDRGALLLIFEDHTGRQVDFDLRGTLKQVLARALPAPRTGPGRPKLGVVAREISLLPRHWEWLEQQPNGASAAIRRLVDQARNHEPEIQRARLAIDAAARFLSAIAGNFPNYEDATRALYAGDSQRLDKLTRGWPRDIQAHLRRMLNMTITS